MAHLFLTSALDGGKWSIFTHKPHYHQKKSPQYTTRRMLRGPQRQSGHLGDKKYLFPLLGVEPQSSSSEPTCYAN